MRSFTLFPHLALHAHKLPGGIGRLAEKPSAHLVQHRIHIHIGIPQHPHPYIQRRRHGGPLSQTHPIDKRPGTGVFDGLVEVAHDVWILARRVKSDDTVIPGSHRQACLRPETAQALNRSLKMLGLGFDLHRLTGLGRHNHQVVGILHFFATLIVVPVGQIDNLLFRPTLLYGLAQAPDK